MDRLLNSREHRIVPEEVDALYARYLQFMRDSEAAILPLLTTESTRRLFARTHVIMPRAEFEANLLSMAPETLTSYRDLLIAGYSPFGRTFAEFQLPAGHRIVGADG